MERFVVIFSALIFILFAQNVLSSDQDEKGNVDTTPKKKIGQYLFGPRLGRRKRNPNEMFQPTMIERQQLDALIDLIRESPWSVVALNSNEGKRYDVNFVPRLGRDSGEELISLGTANIGSEHFIQDPEFVGEVMSQRSPPFAPRLGKRVLPFSPRLGREIYSDHS